MRAEMRTKSTREFLEENGFSRQHFNFVLRRDFDKSHFSPAQVRAGKMLSCAREKIKTGCSSIQYKTLEK